MSFVEKTNNIWKRALQTGISAACLMQSFGHAAEWNGGSDWALFDVPERRAMWVWNLAGASTSSNSWDGVWANTRAMQNYKGSRDMFFDFCENKSIRLVYLYGVTWEWNQDSLNAGHIPNEEDWVPFMEAAAARGVQIWLMGYLWDDMDDARMTEAANKQAIVKIMKAIAAFNKAHPATPIAGYHNDQEPGTTSVYDDLLDTLKNGQDWVNANAPGLRISQALRPINSWRQTTMTWNGSTKTLNQHIISTIGHTAYMAYDDTPSTMLNTLELVPKTENFGRQILKCSCEHCARCLSNLLACRDTVLRCLLL